MIFPMAEMTAASINLSKLPDSLFHPLGKGRIIQLDPPYQLPEGMDLRGIAAVILKREQNPETARYIVDMDSETRQALRRSEGRLVNNELAQKAQSGPRAPAPLPSEPLLAETAELVRAFNDLTKPAYLGFHLSASNALKFHTDGVGGRTPSWRLTYAYTGAQTICHTAILDDTFVVHGNGGTGFPLLPDQATGQQGVDYFEAQGAVLFRTFSANALVHKTPDGQDNTRVVLTIDANTPKNLNCTATCPFPCRTL